MSCPHRDVLLAVLLLLPTPAFAAEPAPAATRERVLYRIPVDGGEIEKVVVPAASRRGATSSMSWSSKPVAPSIAAIADTDTTYIQFQHGFDEPSTGACLPRGWTAQERSTLVFAHVDSKYLLNDAFITMDTKALWFGTDLATHPEEVALWYYPSGYGSNWSQRLTSGPFTNGNLSLTFEGRVDFSPVSGISAGAVNRGLTVQALKSDGKWDLLVARWMGSSGVQIVSTLGLRGKASFKCVVATHPDSQPGFPFATPLRLRVVLQSTTTGSDEDGAVASSPTPEGAAIIDNIRLRDLDGGPDPIPLHGFEDGTTGSWALSARNGSSSGTTHIIRDLPAPDPIPSLEKGFDAHNPSCLWQFTAANDRVPDGCYTYLNSPWFAREPSADTTFVFNMLTKFAPGGRAPDFLGRFMSVLVRGKNAGDAHARRMFCRPGFIFFDLGTSDTEMAVWDNPVAYPFGFVIGSIQCDSLQLCVVVYDFIERFNVNVATRPPTRLPWFDELRFEQFHADADYDGVRNSLDACPGVSAAGQDADRNGCVDATGTLRHVESWANASLPLHVTLSQDGDPAITNGSDLQALRDAFSTWTSVPGASLQVVEDPLTPQQDASGTDGINLITFQDDYAFPGNVLAITPTLSFTRRTNFDDVMRPPGEIVDADIVFNPAATFRTPTAGPPTGFDLESVAAHEIGHLLGLSHSGAADATMFPVLQAGTLAASLESDDQAAAAAAYPGVTLLSAYGRIAGRVTRGSNGAALPGALVMAVRLASGEPSDTAATDYTNENGDYRLFRLPAGDYAVRVEPLDGSVPALVPGAINARVNEIAQTNFKPEWYGGPESNDDDPAVRQTLAVAAGGSVTANVITNIDVTAPTVGTVSPAASALDVRIDTPILVTFSEAVFPDSVGRAFKLRTVGGGGTLGGRGQLLTPGLSFVFVPDNPLQFSTDYEILITTSLQDVEGNSLVSPHATVFSTQSPPAVTIANVSPREAPAGALVTLTGAGYDAGVPNRVYFSTSAGFAGYVLGTQVTPTSMVVEVPSDAVSGNMKVEVNGDESNLFTFSLLTSSVAAPSPNGDAVSVGFPPSDVALAPDGKTAFAVGEGGFVRINLDPGRASYREAVPTALDSCRRVALLSSGLRAYVTRPGLSDVAEVDADPLSGTFGQALAFIPVPGVPEGIVVAPSGQRAYVTLQGGDVVVELDVDPASSLYRRVLREIAVPNAMLAGGIAVDPRRERLVLTTENLGIVSVDLDTTTLVTTLSDQAGGASVAVTPGGNRVLSCAPDPDGASVLFADPLAAASGAVEVGGRAGDVTISPDGATALITNAELGQLQILDVTQPTPRLVANVTTGSTPVAVSVSGGGTQVAAANFAAQTISFYNVVSTATPVRVTPPVAMPGDRVAVAVTGGALPGGVTVETGAATVAALHAVSSAASFQVPAVDPGVTTVTLIGGGARSLALPFEVLDPILTLDPRATGVALDPAGVDCGSGPVDGALRLLRVSPDGRLLAVSREIPGCARVDVYQAVPDVDGALGARVVDGASLAGATQIRDLAFTPDGRRLWVATDAAGLFEVDVDPQSPGLGSVLAFGAATAGSARALATDPMGRWVVAGVEPTPGTYRVQLWSPGRTLSTQVSVTQVVHSLAITPDGRYAVAGGEGRAHLVDLAAPALLGTTPLHAALPPDAITSIAVTTNSRHAVGLFPNNAIAIWNVDPAVGAIGQEIYFGTVSVAGAIGQLAPASDGSSVLAACANCATLTRIFPGSVPGLGAATLGQPARALARSADGRTLWVSNWNDGTLAGGVSAFTLSPGSTFALVTGAGQSAAAGQTLPLPVRVRLLDDATGHDVSGAMVRFSLASAAQGAIDDGVLQVVRPTDAAGEAQVSWTMPPAGADVSLTVTALGIPGATLAVSAQSTVHENLATPVAIEFGPPAGATAINAGSELFVRFNQRMVPAGVDSGALVIVGQGRAPFTARFQDDGRSLFLKPSVTLAYGAACTIVVKSPIRDQQGQALATEFRSAFTVQPPPTLAVQSLSPPGAPTGAPVTLNGSGFSHFPGANIVSFNGVVAPVVSASVVSLVTHVPATAISGPLTVSVGASTSSPVPFEVFPPNPTPLRIGIEAGARQGIEAIRVTPDASRAYITLPAANCVLAFDIAQRRVIKTIPVGLNPQGLAIEPEGRYAYVANTGGDDVSVIDIDPGSPTYHRTLPGPVHPIRVGDTPMGLVVSAFGPTVLVINQGSGTISIIDANPSAATFDRVTHSVNVGSGSRDVSVTPDGTRAYVATQEGIVVIDVGSRAVIKSIPVGSGGQNVTVSPDGTLLFALSGSGVLHIVDIAPGSATYNQVVRSKPVGSGGQNVTVSPDGTLLYVTLRDLNVTRVFRILGGAAGGPGGSVAPGDPTDLELLETIEVGEGPAGIAILPDGSAALVVNQSAGTVSVLRSDSLLTDVPPPAAALELRLGVHPTPSLGTAFVRFSLTRRSAVEVDVFDLQGRLVKRLVSGAFDAGPHTASWRGDDREGGRVGAGIYFVRMRAEDRTLRARVVWLE